MYCNFSFVESVIVPYIERQQDEEDLPLKQYALCIFDIYKAHQEDLHVRQLLLKHNIHIVYIPVAVQTISNR